jgi:hypothetical protein
MGFSGIPPKLLADRKAAQSYKQSYEQYQQSRKVTEEVVRVAVNFPPAQSFVKEEADVAGGSSSVRPAVSNTRRPRVAACLS